MHAFEILNKTLYNSILLSTSFLYSYMQYNIVFSNTFSFFCIIQSYEIHSGHTKSKSYYNIHISPHMTIESRIMRLVLEKRWKFFYIPEVYRCEVENRVENLIKRIFMNEIKFQFARNIETVFLCYILSHTGEDFKIHAGNTL